MSGAEDRTSQPAPTEPADQQSDPAETRSPEPGRRPSPGPVAGAPSPTSRARRAAAAGVQGNLRRPSPGPSRAQSGQAQPAAERDDAANSAVATAIEADETIPAVSKPVKARSVKDKPSDTKAQDEQAVEPTAHRVRASSPLWLAVLLVLAIVALAGVSGWLASSTSRSGSVSQRDQALSAAKASVPLILSYNYKSFDAGLAKAQAQLTGRAQSDYVKAMTGTVKPTAAKTDTVVQAQTDGAGVESVSPDGNQVTVLVFGEQQVTNASLSTPRIDPFRVRATLDRVGGHWLISKFNQI